MPAIVPGAANDARGGTRGRRIVGRFAQLLFLAVSAATLLAVFARLHWIADLATHFPLQYAALSLVAAAAFAWTRRPVWALAAAALFGLNAYVAFGRPPAVAAGPAQSQPFRLLVANVFYANSDHDRLVAYVRAAQPDAAVFVEVTPSWRAGLRPLARELPYESPMPGARHGVLVLSRLPIRSADRLMLAAGGDPFVRVGLDAGGRTIGLIAVHAAWPLGAANSRVRNLQFAQLATLAASAPEPLVIAGDFNATPHSPHFADMLGAAGLRSAAHERLWAPTWPTFFLPAGIQIDHVLVSRGIRVIRFETGPVIGSDHLPVIVDLML